MKYLGYRGMILTLDIQVGIRPDSSINTMGNGMLLYTQVKVAVMNYQPDVLIRQGS